MSVFYKNGDFATERPLFAGAVLDASSETNRFLAMKQLLDIAAKKTRDPSYTPAASEFTYATKGAVCILPSHPGMFEGYSFDLLYSKDQTVQAIPASTTKVAAIITALPYINLKDKYTIVSADVQTGSGNYFSAGDILTNEDLLYGMLLPSSNTCAMALAHEVGAIILGNPSASASSCVSAFVSAMNAKAASIGCTGTTFDTPSGLSTATKSTALDLLRILIDAASFPEVQRIWNKKTYTINIGGTNARTQAISTSVTNSTLEEDYYIFGGKTGHLTGSADALVMIAGIK